MRIFEASSHRDRTRAAQDFLCGFDSREVLLVGATREAADEVAIQASSTASFGIHRFSPGQLISRMAREAMAEQGLAPASALAVEAVATRVAHEARVARELQRLSAVTAFPGFPRALGRTLTELRLNEVTPETIRAKWPVGSEIASLLERFDAAMEQASLADRADLIDLALANASASAMYGIPLVLLDVPIGSRLEARLWGTLLRAATEALVTIPRGDVRSLEMLRATAGSLSDPANQSSNDSVTWSPMADPDDPRTAIWGESAIGRLQRGLFEAIALNDRAGSGAVMDSSQRSDDRSHQARNHDGAATESGSAEREEAERASAKTSAERAEVAKEPPDQESPDLESPDLESPDLESPDLESPDLESPDLGSPDLGSLDQDDSVEVFSAPGEARECVEIARRILQSDVPFDRIAVLLRAPELYNHPLETALRRARIPAYFARGTRRPDPAGRAFLALLDCAVERFSARRFSEYLSFSQVPDSDSNGGTRPAPQWAPPADETLISGPAQLSLFTSHDQEGDVSTIDDREGRVSSKDGQVSPSSSNADGEHSSTNDEGSSDSSDGDGGITSTFVHDWTEWGARAGSLRAPWKWEEYLVDAAVMHGYDRWVRRIRGYRLELSLQIDQLLREDPESASLSRLERDRINLGHLERFALPVIKILAEWPRQMSWGEWREALTELAPRVLRKPERVLSVLAELEPMSEVGPVTLAEVRDVLWNRLALLETDPPARRYGQVFVATPDQARGREFDLVFVPGLAERLFPKPPHEDPLLLDQVRGALSDALLRQDDRARNERLQLALAVGAASSKVVLSYPRIELSMARPRVPSFYCLEVTRAVQGEIPDLDLLERGAAERADARLAWPAPSQPEIAIDDVEHDLAVLGPLLATTGKAVDRTRSGHARYLFSLNPHLARSLRARYSRWRIRKWTTADGITRRTEEIAPILDTHRLNERAYSVTALENFAVCPYRFLLAAIHRIEPRADAAPLVRMDPLTRGSFIHEIQARLFKRLRDSSLLPLRAASVLDAERALAEVVTEVAAEYADKVAPAIERVWEDEVQAIRDDLKIWLRKMVDEPWTPAHFELAFGLQPGIKTERDRASVPDPVRITGGWLLRGAVDLVERAGERIRVTDHKTGKNRTEVGTVTANGKVLQPVLYGLVVESMLGSPVEQSRLYYCTSRGGFSERIVHLDERSRLFGSEAMQWIDQAVAAGKLPAFPEKDACSRCDFRAVCGPNEETRVGQKPGHELESLRDVRELP